MLIFQGFAATGGFAKVHDLPLPAPSAAIPCQLPDDAFHHSNLYYETNAAAYAERTLGADLAPLFENFAAALPKESAVLDLGCGAGRELKPLVENGHRCIGVDLSPSLAEIAARHSGARTIAADIRDLDFPSATFDGILAIASLLHLKASDRERLLGSIARWLRPDGVLLVTMKLGAGIDLAADGRGYALIEQESWLDALRKAGLVATATSQTPVADTVSNSPHDWLAVLARRV